MHIATHALILDFDGFPKFINIFSLVNFPVVSGGFALLAGTGATLAGLGGAGGVAGVGAVLGGGGVVTGIIAAGTMGLFGQLITRYYE